MKFSAPPGPNSFVIIGCWYNKAGGDAERQRAATLFLHVCA
jgi:hypothetical protein